MKIHIICIVVFLVLCLFKNVESSFNIKQKVIYKSYYGSPDCDYETSIWVTSDIVPIDSVTMNFYVSERNTIKSADNMTFSTIFITKIPIGSWAVLFINGATAGTYYYTGSCKPPPSSIGINTFSSMQFNYPFGSGDSLSSLATSAYLLSNSIQGYYPLKCRDVLGSSPCYQCQVEPLAPFVGKYNLTVQPLFSESCNYNTALLSLDIYDPTNEKNFSNVTPLNPYKKVKSDTDFEIVGTYPIGITDNIVNSEYNDISPSVIYVVQSNGTINLMSNLYFNSNIALSEPAPVIPQYMGSFPSSNSLLSFYYIRVFIKKTGPINYSLFDIVNGKYSSLYTIGSIVIVNYKTKQDLKINTFKERIVNGNLYLSSDFNLSQSDSFKINYNSDIRQFKFPFGFGKGTLQSYNHRFDYPLSVYQKEFISQPFYQNQSIPTFTYTNPIIEADTTPPVLNYYNIVPVGLEDFNYTVEAYDLESGIYSITFKEDYDPRGEATVVLYSSDLANGTIWNGTFTYSIKAIAGPNHDRSFSIILKNRAGLTQTFKSGQHTLHGLFINYFPKQISWDERNISSFSVNLVSGNYKINIGFTDPIPSMIPRLQIFFYPQNSQVAQSSIHFGSYDSGTSSYAFQVLQNSYVSSMGGNVKFSLFGDRDIPSSNIYILTNSNWGLTSGYKIIMKAPVIGSITVLQNTTLVSMNITFSCFGQNYCMDTPIANGKIVVQGDFNPIPIVIKINPYQSTHVIGTFPIESNYCRSQTYRIVSAALDDGNLQSDSDNPDLLSPLAFLDPNQLSFAVTCSTPTPDNIPPTIGSFIVSQKSASLATGIIVYNAFLIINDNQKIRKTAYLYLSAPCGLFKKIDLISSSGSDTQGSIVFLFEIDKYWSTGNVSLSVYGIVDMYDNFNGYSTSDLASLGYESTVPGFNFSGPPPPNPQLQPTGIPTNTPSPTPNITKSPTPTPNVTVTPAPCTNKCSGNGICILDNQCKCNNGFYGPNCEGTVLEIPKPLPNPEEPTIISEPNSEINLDIQFSELLELNSDKSIIERYPLQNKKWKMESSSDNNTFTYSTKINNETTLYIIIDLTTDERTIEFAGLNITIPPHSIKYTMKLDQYFFKSQLNILQLRMSTAFNSSESLCSSSIDTSSNTKDLEYIKIQYNGKILYGRFVQRSLVDGTPQVATTELIQSTESNGTSFIGINIPNYENQVILDPNFSVLVTDDYDKCKSSSKLSTGAIVGIVVGCAAFVVVAFAGITIFGSKTRRMKFAYKLKQRFDRKDKTRNVKLT